MRMARFAAGSTATDGESTQFTDRYLLWMLGQFLRPYWRQLIVVFLLLIGVTALSLLPPFLIQRAVDDPIAKGELERLIPLGIVYFAAIIAVFGLRFSYTYLLQTVGQSALVNLRQRLFEHILRQDMRYFNTTPVGQIVARLSNDIDALTELLSTSIVLVVSNLVTLIGIIGVMFAINWRLALISLAVIPVMTIATIYSRTHVRRTSGKLHRVVAEWLAFLNEQFSGMLVVQLFGRQRQSIEEFEAINNSWIQTHTHLRDQYTWYASVLQLLTAVGLGLVLYGGGHGVFAGWATLGTLIAFIQYQQRSFDPILNLAEQFAQIQMALAAGERIARTLRVEPELRYPQLPSKIANFKGEISFEDVHFHYDEDAPVLRGINFQIPSGQTVAIVGATGAGKTSLAGILARFYDVQGGRVLIDGVDVREFSQEDLRQFVAVVPQSPYIFNGTIADNLRMFSPQTSDEEMLRAAETACAAPFIAKLPGEYNHILLPGGSNLSQGQRQLLALARALIHSPSGILVLDEATSSIDTETEALIQQGLRQVLQGRTSIIIAHRLSTVREADRIIVMQRGKIIEDGTHESLLAKGGHYATLHRRQFADDIDESELESADETVAK